MKGLCIDNDGSHDEHRPWLGIAYARRKSWLGFRWRLDGSYADGCGTSYAAPFLARQATIRDSQIEEISRET